jgi:hypothetical protein
MNIGNLKLFINELRTTQSKQIRASLNFKDGFCAVGIAGKLIKNSEFYKEFNPYTSFDKWVDIPIKDGMAEFLSKQKSLVYYEFYKVGIVLSSFILILNDVYGFSFSQIADTLELFYKEEIIEHDNQTLEDLSRQIKVEDNINTKDNNEAIESNNEKELINV